MLQSCTSPQRPLIHVTVTETSARCLTELFSSISCACRIPLSKLDAKHSPPSRILRNFIRTQGKLKKKKKLNTNSFERLKQMLKKHDPSVFDKKKTS